MNKWKYVHAAALVLSAVCSTIAGLISDWSVAPLAAGTSASLFAHYLDAYNV